MTRRLITLAAIALAGLGIVFVTAPAPTQVGASAERTLAAAKRPVVVAMFYSGFCAACQILNPRLEAARSDFVDDPVTFVTFNKTWSLWQGGEARADLAEGLAIQSVYTRYKDRGQGFALVVDPANEQVLATLTLTNSADDIRAIIRAAMAR